ncbi:MAG: glycosyltransferase [Clostridia bacterium]|nr:glycosyltransferase [Clostridia bacterium]
MFAYNRPDHLKKTVEALKANKEAKESILYIFSDGPRIKKAPADASAELIRQTDEKNEKTRQAVEETRQYIRAVADESFFREVIVTEAPENKGLATSIITGVDWVINRHGRVIVIEDDAVCAPGFLRFMNDALDFYESYDRKIWMIGGYCPKLDIPQDYAYDFYVMGRGSSFAWATWKDRWQKIDWTVASYRDFRNNHRLRRAFNRYGDDRANMLDAQMLGKIDSWAVRFAYEMFRNGMYAVLPTRSLIQTIGRDGTGTHATQVSHDFDVELGEAPQNIAFADVDPDERIVKQHTAYFKRSKAYLFRQYVKNCLLKK